MAHSRTHSSNAPSKPRCGPRAIRLSQRVWEGYSYLFNSERNGVVYMVCKEYKNGKCRARAKLKSGVFEPPVTPHTCGDPNFNLENEIRFCHALQQEMMRKPYQSAKQVYLQESVKHKDAAAQLPFSKVQRTMYRHRMTKVIGDRIFQSLDEFHAMLTSEENKHLLAYSNGTISADLIKAGDATSLVLWDLEFVAKFKKSDILNIDVTFKTVPIFGKIQEYQLLMVIAVIHNHIFPISWALMDKRTQEAYTAVLKVVLEPFENYSGSVMIDFEVAVRRSVRSILRRAKIHGCLDHYSQAIYNKARKLDLLKRTNKAKTLEILRKIVGLALLPMDRIRAAFKRIRDETPGELTKKFNAFFKYFEYYWLNIRGPQQFCVYRQMRRTNNPAKSYIAQLNKHLPKSPSPMTLIKEIVSMAEEANTNFLSVAQGMCVRRRRLRNIMEDLNLKYTWDEFDAGHLSISSFLSTAAHTIHKSENTTYYTSEDEETDNDDDDPASDQENEETNTASLRKTATTTLPRAIEEKQSATEENQSATEENQSATEENQSATEENQSATEENQSATEETLNGRTYRLIAIPRSKFVGKIVT